MKKLLFTLAIVLGSVTLANAQEVGKMWVGGSVGFSSSKSKLGDIKGKSAINYNVTPEFGYIVSDKIAIGLGLGYIHEEKAPDWEDLDLTDLENFDLSVTKRDGFVVNPFVRVALLKGNIGGLFIDAGGKYKSMKIKGVDGRFNDLEAGIYPGVSVNIAENLALIAKFGFLGYKNETSGSGDAKLKNDEFGLDLDLSQTQIGVCFIF